MDFLKCSIAGTSYGAGTSEVVEVAAAQQMAVDLDDHSPATTPRTSVQEIEVDSEGEISPRVPIKGFGFEDVRMMHRNWLREPHADDILLFFRILAICHTAVPELNEETGKYTYEAESPYEASFLTAASEFGFEFFKRTQSSVYVYEKLYSCGLTIEMEYEILNLLEFTSKRKRMSVIVRDEEGQILLLCKGADSIIFERLAKNGKTYLEPTTKHLNEYGEAGLRTLALAYRKLDEDEYSAWNAEFHKAKTSIGSDRDELLEKTSDMIEKDLLLVGVTALEDMKGSPNA